MEREDQKDLIDVVIASAGIDPKEIRFPKGDVLAEIFSFVVNTEKPLAELLAEKFPYFLPLLEKIKDVHDRYEKKKKATNSMDFDDLLEKTLTMFQRHERNAPIQRCEARPSRTQRCGRASAIYRSAYSRVAR